MYHYTAIGSAYWAVLCKMRVLTLSELFEVSFLSPLCECELTLDFKYFMIRSEVQ